MAQGIGIGIDIPRGLTGNAGFPTAFDEILAENGDFIIAESGAYPTYMIVETVTASELLSALELRSSFYENVGGTITILQSFENC